MIRASVLRFVVLAVASLVTQTASAAATTTFELVHGWGYNVDFNGDSERTTLNFRLFQPWKYGSITLGYSITGPFASPAAPAVSNEKGGMAGSMAANFSIKEIGQRISSNGPFHWGALSDFFLHIELENAAGAGAVTYAGALFNIAVPHFDYVSTSAYIRQTWSLSGVDLQLGGAWQITFALGKVTDLLCDGFFVWGVFGEGEGVEARGPDEKGRYERIKTRGRPFFLARPRLLLDIGKLTSVADKTLYSGIDYQLAWNRYLQQGVTEHVPQLLVRLVVK